MIDLSFIIIFLCLNQYMHIDYLIYFERHNCNSELTQFNASKIIDKSKKKKHWYFEKYQCLFNDHCKIWISNLLFLYEITNFIIELNNLLKWIKIRLTTRFICTWCQLRIFWFYSVSNRSQKSQEISIQRSSNDVRTLRDQKSHHAEFSLTRQHFFLTVTINLQRRLMTCRC